MPNKEDLKKLIDNHRQRLERLKEKNARYGLDTPPHILVEIEDTEAVINDLEIQSASLESAETDNSIRTDIQITQDTVPLAEDLKRQIDLYSHRLQRLKERRALHGQDTPPSVLIEIEDVEARIEELTKELIEQNREDANLSSHLDVKRDQETISRRNDLEKLIHTYERRLQKLKEQQAFRGLDTPPHIMVEIEDIEDQIARLDTELKSLEEQRTEPPSYNFTHFRRLLNNLFDDTSLNNFSLDYFTQVYDQFSRGMRKDEKISLLLNDCRQRPNGLEQLLEALKHEAKVEDIAHLSLEVEPSSKDLAKVETVDVALIEPTYGDPETVTNYLEVVRDQCGKVETRPYFQLSKVPGAPPRLSLMGDEGFGGVFIPLRFDLPAQEDVELPQVLSDTNHLVIVGGAGSGKTTILHYLAMVLTAQDPARNRVELGWVTPSLPLPILVALRDFEHSCQTEPQTYQRNPDSFLRFIDDHFDRWHPGRVSKGFLSDLVKSGNAWLLLDGLDEVANFDHRVAIRHLIEQLSTISSRNRLVITARVAAYTDTRTQLNDHFSEGTIRDLTPDQWQPMLRRIYTGLESRRDVVEERIERLITRIEATPLLQNMVKTPLMVWTATLIHYAGSELPEQRAELYSAYVNVLLGERLHEEESPDAAHSLREERWPMEDRRLYLTYAAHKVHTMAETEQGGRGQHHAHVVVDEYELVKRILGPYLQEYLGRKRQQAEQEAEDFVAMMAERSGLLHAHETGYSFGDHLTIQEFLTACYLVENVRNNTQEWLAFLQAHVGQSWWEQVFMLMSGYLLQWPQQARHFLLSELGNLPGQGDAPLYGLGWAGRALLEIPASRVGWHATVCAELGQRLMKVLSECSKNVSVEARIEAGEVLGLLGDIRFHGEHILPRFIKIPGGPFWMGTDQAEIDVLARRIPLEQLMRQLQLGRWVEAGEGVAVDVHEVFTGELFRHQVVLDDFAIAAHPTTNAMFARFIDDGGYADERWWTEAISAEKWVGGKIVDPLGERSQPAYWNEVGFNGLNQPVIGVTWYEAAAYCCWLTYKLQVQKQLRPNELIRLPTEAEWERVARSTSSNNGPPPSASTYPWGNEWELGCANTEELGLERTTPVGIFANGATPEGVFDLAGNVSEWCGDWYGADTYKQRAGQVTKNPTGPPEGSAKVLRGGSWQNDQYFVRSALRDRENPQNRSRSIGFRLVKGEISSKLG